MEKISVIKGNIAQLPFHVDAIVNAANSALIPGGGVDGALNQQAGPELAQAMAEFGGTPTGTAVYTDAYKLNADYVIHAVGPRYIDGNHGEMQQLASAYQFVMAAKQLKVSSIAIPFLSTGVYNYPLEDAIKIGIYFAEQADLDAEIYFVAFDTEVETIAKEYLPE